ncbi:MAG: SxtJ family membrane protein [Myxococcota bacterium]
MSTWRGSRWRFAKSNLKLTDKNFHAYHKEHGELEVGSDRSFALVFTVVFSLVGLFPVFFSTGAPRLWALGIAGVFLGLGLIVPHLLHPLNVLWMKFGALLNAIVSPIVLGGLFYLVVTPMGLIVRLFGHDLLRLKLDDSSSYWIRRDPPGPPPASMKNQF